MAITTSTLTQELYANVVQAALFTLSEQTVIRPLVRNYDMTGTPGLTAQVPIYPALTATGVAENVDLDTAGPASFDTSSVEIVCSEIGTFVNLTDLSRESATTDVAAAIGRQIGDAMAKKVDTDLAALFPGFSQSVGAAGDDITVETMFKAAAILRANQAPGPYVCVLHPYQAFTLKKQLTQAGNTPVTDLSNIGNQALLDGFVARVAGIDVFESTVVSADAGDSVSGTGNFYGAAMSADALGYVLKRSMRIEEQRDATKRSTEIVGSMAYGVKEIFDAYGVGIVGNATLS
jgi:N4-gp56 family major capsid protein